MLQRSFSLWDSSPLENAFQTKPTMQLEKSKPTLGAHIDWTTTKSPKKDCLTQFEWGKMRINLVYNIQTPAVNALKKIATIWRTTTTYIVYISYIQHRQSTPKPRVLCLITGVSCRLSLVSFLAAPKLPTVQQQQHCMHNPLCNTTAEMDAWKGYQKVQLTLWGGKKSWICPLGRIRFIYLFYIIIWTEIKCFNPKALLLK